MTEPLAATKPAKVNEARAAFVAMIKDENFYSEPWARWSLKQHWSGAEGGFADEQLQRRWRDFEAGWKARAKP